MVDHADKKWLRQVSRMERFWRLVDALGRLIHDMVIVAVLIIAGLVFVNWNTARAASKVCPQGSFCLLLPNSTLPADGDECRRARPDLGRPYFTASKRDRTAEPYFQRTCYFQGEPK